MENHFYRWLRRSVRQNVVSKQLLNVMLMAVATLFSVGAYAQDRTVSGKVTDNADGSALPGVTVQVKGANKGTQTDASGAFKINVSGKSVLVFSFIGYGKQEVSVGERSQINIALVSETKALDEVVVVGYGTQKVKDATGSVSSLSTKDFNKGVIASPDQLLQGRVSGVNISASSGEPGAAPTVNIRGAGSIRSGNGPLYVVDGVPLDNSTSDTPVDAGAGTSSARNPLTFLNPNDIENISVLKDASASAIYGARGANGVILITTKKGKGGQGLTFSANTSVSTAAKKYDLLSASDFLAGVVKLGGSASAVDNKSNTNWQDQIFRTAISQDYNLGYGGGNDDTRYRVSLGFSDQQGIVNKSGLTRFNGRLNLSQDLFKDKVVLDLSLTGSNVKNTYAPLSDNAGFQGSLIGAAIIANPTNPVRNADGTYYQPDDTQRNVAAMIDYFNDKDNVNRYLGNLSATWKITSGLSTKVTLGLDKSSSSREQIIDKRLRAYTNTPTVRGIVIDQVTGNGLYSKLDRDVTSKLLEWTATYEKKVGTGLLNLLGGYSYQSFENYGYNNLGYGGVTGDMNSQSGYKKKFSYGDSTKSEMQSFFGRANYSIADKYFFTGTVRMDGSSKFAAGNKYGVFPAFAAKWKLMNESFIPKSVFNDLALRVNWGQTGNQDFAGGISQAVWQNNYNGDAVPVNAANGNIKWETTTTYGVGIDYAFLNGRISGSIDYFNKSTADLLFLAIYAQPAAVKQRWVNLPGNVRNTGVEFSLNLQAVQAKNFTWEVLYNMTTLKNIVENFGNSNINTGAVNGQGLSGAYAQKITNGYALYSFNVPTFTGFDANGLGIYANDGAASIQGNPIPTMTIGLTNNFTYKKWNASFFINGQTGFTLYNNTANALFLAGSLKTGHNVTYDVLSSPENALNAGSVSSRFLEKGDFYRLANASIGRTFEMPASSKIKSLRVSLTAQNLFVITNYSGLDPEVNTNKALDGVPSRGIDYVAYPKARTFTLGINAGF